eukprot:6188474-Pleurochrysis_carterae.AAC.2
MGASALACAGACVGPRLVVGAVLRHVDRVRVSARVVLEDGTAGMGKAFSTAVVLRGRLRGGWRSGSEKERKRAGGRRGRCGMPRGAWRSQGDGTEAE